MAGEYSDGQVLAIRRGIQAAVQMVAEADGKSKLREMRAFAKGLQAVLPRHLWKVYIGDLKPALVSNYEYENAIRECFATLDSVDPPDGYVMRFAVMYGLQQAAGMMDGVGPAERYALDRVKWLVGPPVHAYAPPGFVPPPIQ